MKWVTDLTGNLSFAEPLFLYLFIPWVVLLSLWILVTINRYIKKPKMSYGSKYAILGRMKLWGFVLLSIGLMIPALAKPNWSGVAPEISRGNIEVVILWDNSFSQMAEDIRPSRLEIAKREIMNLESILHEGDKASLFTFGKDSNDKLDLTKDLGALFNQVSRISVPKTLVEDETIFNTNFATALERVYQSLDSQDADNEGKDPNKNYNPKKRSNRIVLLFSDGDDELLNYKPSAGMKMTDQEKKDQDDYIKRLGKIITEYRKRGLKIYPVGVGTVRGVSWISLLKRYKEKVDYPEGLKKEWEGQTTRLDKANLAKLAKYTGVVLPGQSWTVESSQESVKNYIKYALDSNRKALVEIVETKDDKKLWQYLLFAAVGSLALGIMTYPFKGYFRRKFPKSA